MSHPFSSLNSSLGFAEEKHYQKIIIPIFRLVLQNFAVPGRFPYNPSIDICSPNVILVGLLLQFVVLFQSTELVKYLESL